MSAVNSEATVAAEGPGPSPHAAGTFFVACKAIDFLVRLGANIGGLCLLSCALITCYEVVCRYIFGQPTHWTLDLSEYLLIWFGFSSAAFVQQQGRHVAVELFARRLRGQTKILWDTLITILFFGFAAMMMWLGADYTLEALNLKEFSPTMWPVLIWPVKLAVPVGSALLALCLIKDLGLKLTELRSMYRAKGAKAVLKDLPVISAFIFAIGISCYLVTVNGIIGMLMLMFVLLFFGLPIFPTLGLVGAVGIYIVFGGVDALVAAFPVTAFRSLYSFSLVCLPLYVFVGQIIESGGVGEELYECATKWTVGIPGGEAVATMIACCIFAAISTSSVATAATIGLIALPALFQRQYDKNFSYGILAAGGTLGIMIPPSGSMIIYSAVTEESLGKLFLAGALPGLILTGFFILYSMWYSRRTLPRQEVCKPSKQEKLDSTKVALWGLAAPGIIIGGIYTGIFTPLESGAVAAIYAMLMVLLRGKIKVAGILKVLRLSTLNATMVLAIIIGAMILGRFMTMMRIPNLALEYVMAMQLSRWGVFAAVLILMSILGMFLEVISVMLITLPVVYPIMISLHFDGIWFAVIVTLTMELALLTPPVGLNLYVISGVAKAPIAHVLRGVIPFFIIMLICIFIFAFFPSLSTWLPNNMIGG